MAWAEPIVVSEESAQDTHKMLDDTREMGWSTCLPSWPMTNLEATAARMALTLALRWSRRRDTQGEQSDVGKAGPRQGLDGRLIVDLKGCVSLPDAIAVCVQIPMARKSATILSLCSLVPMTTKSI